jgi:26S proteasome regulatory subunit N1
MAPKDSNTATVMAESDKKKETDPTKAKKAEDEGEDSNLSEEDRSLKERLETCVSTVLNEQNEAAVTIPLRMTALDVIVTELRTATASMTSVPKPLKFLRPHFASIKTLYTTLEKLTELENNSVEFRARLADVLAVLAMTMGRPGKSISLCHHCSSVVPSSQLTLSLVVLFPTLPCLQRNERA